MVALLICLLILTASSFLSPCCSSPLVRRAVKKLLIHGEFNKPVSLPCGSDVVPSTVESVKWIMESKTDSSVTRTLFRYDKVSETLTPTPQSPYFHDKINFAAVGINNATLEDENWVYVCTQHGGGNILNEAQVSLEVTDQSLGSLHITEAKYDSAELNKHEEVLTAKTVVKVGTMLKFAALAKSYKPIPTLKWYVNGKEVKKKGTNILTHDSSKLKHHGYGDATSYLEYQANEENTLNVSCQAYGPEGDQWNAKSLGFVVKVHEHLPTPVPVVPEQGGTKIIPLIVVIVIMAVFILVLIIFVVRKKRTNQGNQDETRGLLMAETDSTLDAFKHIISSLRKKDMQFTEMTTKCFATMASKFNHASFQLWFEYDTRFHKGPLEGLWPALSVDLNSPTFSFYSILTIAKFPDYFRLAEEEKIIEPTDVTGAGILYHIPTERDVLDYVPEFLKKHDYLGLESSLSQNAFHAHGLETDIKQCEEIATRAYKEAFETYGQNPVLQFSSNVPTLLTKVKMLSGDHYVTLLLHNFHAIRFEGWPESTREWKNRKRGVWPSPGVFGSVAVEPCYLLRNCEPPKKVYDESYEETENQFVSLNQWIQHPKCNWFLSFAPAEKILLASLTEKQNLCFFIFKWLYYTKLVRITEVPQLQDQPKEDLGDPCISSKGVLHYDIPMTVMFRKLEEESTSFWEQPYKETVRLVLQKLLKCLENEQLPHYFIAGINILEDHPETEKLTESIDTLRSLTQHDANPVDSVDVPRIISYTDQILDQTRI